jgi:hypothetical protein
VNVFIAASSIGLGGIDWRDQPSDDGTLMWFIQCYILEASKARNCIIVQGVMTNLQHPKLKNMQQYLTLPLRDKLAWIRL